MMLFVVKGTMALPEGERRFSKEVKAESEKMARETALCLLGSHHHLRRNKITISSVEKVEK